MENFFPGNLVARKEQVDLLNALKPLMGTTKFIVVQAPTGSGKSAICSTITRFFSSQSKKTYLLCSRKYLQTQYLEEYETVFSNFWGKPNYRCPLIAASCAGCPADNALDSSGYMTFLKYNCTNKSSKNIGDKCPYISARDKAQIADASLLNFEAFMANALNDLWEERDIMLIDEAHCLADRAVSFFTININPAWANIKKGETQRVTKDSEKVKTLLDLYKKKVSSLEEAQLPVPRELLNSIKFLDTENVSWILNSSELVMKPINIGILLEEYIYKYADQVVFLSGSITPNLSRELGVNKSNSHYIKVRSGFPIENHRMVYIPSIGRLNRKVLADQQVLKKIAKAILNIRLERPLDRGIVHTTSYLIVDKIKSSLEGLLRELSDGEERFDSKELNLLFHTRDKKLEELLQEYRSTAGAVLFTPSLNEGFDGKGGLVEWQVLLKAPFPYMGDPRIKELLNSSFGKKLFKDRALSTVIQTLGRGLRDHKDRCTNYIFDENIARLLGESDNIPSHVDLAWKNRKTK